MLVGYALLGALWLNLKTTGEMQAQMQRYARFKRASWHIPTIQVLCRTL
ncbi:hypothetical protein RKLH11_4057 [Rhodobacteraceae bacterium KLH11]|nr:hypothetical protein RKLH11_4057 [Rhodobacteraceae bacterium KLH11]